tara:strand:- start:78 stop:836 length:759 start_codon:yes stop_codon:yes gene_type:complete
MSTLPLNLIVFSTTMGHSGRHTYQDCINNLNSKIDLSIFSNKLLHLKSRDGEEHITDEIKSFCSHHNIRVIESKEDIVHHSENHLSHSAGYFKDIYTAYSDLEIRKQKYSLWLEDDWLFKTNDERWDWGETSLESAIRESIKFLDNNPDQLCVRFNGAEKFCDPEGEFNKESENIFTQAINYTEYGPTFTFQPNISRTSEIFAAWKAGQNYLDRLGSYHCELMSGDLLKTLTNSDTPFSFFNPNKIYSYHIG